MIEKTLTQSACVHLRTAFVHCDSALSLLGVFALRRSQWSFKLLNFEETIKFPDVGGEGKGIAGVVVCYCSFIRRLPSPASVWPGVMIKVTLAD